MATGTCTYNECFYDIFTKNCRFFTIESCPYIQETSLKSYKLGNVLSISGRRGSGKTMLISHIIYDLINTRDLNGKIVLIDTELGFKYEHLKKMLDSSVCSTMNSSKFNADEIIYRNFLYLPARDLDEFATILNCLEACLASHRLYIHCLVIDSLFGLYKRLAQDKHQFNKLAGEKLNSIVKMCRKNSVFLIYTNDIESNFEKKHFYVDLKSTTAEREGDQSVKVEDEVLQTPVRKRPNEHTLDDMLFFNDMLLSYESVNSNEYKIDQWSNDQANEHMLKKENNKEAEVYEWDKVRIKGSIPGSWISKEPSQSKPEKQMEIFMSSSRNLERNYITFVSKDGRTRSQHIDKSKEKPETGELSTGEQIKESTGKRKRESQKHKIKFREETHRNKIDGKEERAEEESKENEHSLGEEILSEHNFRVYRIDEQCTYKECSYDFSNFL
ncbi:conserved hypothetical protein [Theileria orientalis strain Shintoku]|uniref:Uncharacterized protein n=1 Tax=Theileria orientalis strain Shintoku TaxID=869250 RepID=J4D762_THEOR|nr:conserved hypothetical protein [Theileria orientalis strain Shintoku]BAM39985.1 conserved hypothetical protein [Theileria orientalis strain Shintoku]|eukprot:XP_009690286.1 conserved hypothetical protein [Theileria orientalis strain Shintoku]